MKPCPFCGSDDVIVNNIDLDDCFVVCPECNAMGPRTAKGSERALELWNKWVRPFQQIDYTDFIPTMPGYYWVKCYSVKTMIMEVVQRPRISFLELKQPNGWSGPEFYTPVESVTDAQWCGPIKEPT